MSNLNNLGLLNSLCELINTNYDSNNHAIAAYLIEHLSHVQQVTVNQIVDNAFVSRSAVRRFCESLGYQSLTDLKSSISQLIFPSDIRHRQPADYQINQQLLTKLIQNMLTDMNQVCTPTKIQALVQQIHDHQKVLLMCANNTSSTLLKFQQELIYANKLVTILDQNYLNNQLITALDSQSLIITVSTSGKYAELSENLLASLPGTKILITGNHQTQLEPIYDTCMYISEQSFSTDHLGIYGKYGITYLFDQIFLHYVTTYFN
ncbi:MurR/RpiR family transcriptional regulator [Bombilactobacillus folatiphilus]|uniref:MurR/RpiR family transcriptional regulator n=1 Tax=Bombilactobacillus folatiphilus TaxID=2923362 RepID=A0ABY4P815_9LACO|nr:MurR/RpiR family transcriptional regulator [Bombilactobacillus folatiphilus]UQS81782.1 MurR/RpiR family transcriptional regulator [Bombilactobacillus folatiphilus]